jgi:N-acetylglucosaminyl-diphospho-decaprenol L-rhamnosyltransferase
VTGRWAAVVVNYEAGDHLAACVASLLADTSAGEPPHVVVVDNGSRDRSTAAVRDRFPDVDVISTGANLGYAGAANIGIRATSAPVVAVCNPDVVVETGCAGALVARLDAESDLAAVGPVIRNPDGSTYPSARSFPQVGDAVGHGFLGLFWPENPFTTRYRQLNADPHRPRDVDWISGAALWLRRAALDAVGGWDAGYFMYVEDVDLCWRLRRGGWRVAFEPGGTAVHEQGVSAGRHPYRMILEHHRSLGRFATKRLQGPRRLLLPFAFAFLAVRALLALAHRMLVPRARLPRVTG